MTKYAWFVKAWCENSGSQHEARSSQYPGENSMQTKSMEAHTLCSKERSVCVGGNDSASERQDRPEKNDEDKCPWSATWKGNADWRDFLCVPNIYILYPSACIPIQSYIISLSTLQVWKLRQGDTMLFVQSHKTLKHGLVRHLTQSVN